MTTRRIYFNLWKIWDETCLIMFLKPHETHTARKYTFLKSIWYISYIYKYETERYKTSVWNDTLSTYIFISFIIKQDTNPWVEGQN